jgi:protein-S-isoprenylcysteine O-methyltransferase Ste14
MGEPESHADARFEQGAGELSTVKLILKNLLFSVFIPGSAAVYVPLLLIGGLPPSAGWARLISAPFFAIALTIYLWAVWSFAVRGRGTPLPIDAPTKLVVQGPYLYARNPMYLAVMSALLGWLLIYRSLSLLLYTVGVGSALTCFVIWYEEPHLRQTFGDEYDRYRSTVPRWLPRWPRPPGL